MGINSHTHTHTHTHRTVHTYTYTHTHTHTHAHTCSQSHTHTHTHTHTQNCSHIHIHTHTHTHTRSHTQNCSHIHIHTHTHTHTLTHTLTHAHTCSQSQSHTHTWTKRRQLLKASGAKRQMFPAEMRIDFPSGHGSLINAPTSCSDNGPVAIRATALSRNRASGSSAPHLFASSPSLCLVLLYPTLSRDAGEEWSRSRWPGFGCLTLGEAAVVPVG